MSDDLITLLAELRQDHRNMALLLNKLEREAEQVYDGRAADFEMVHDIMHYMTAYPDVVHHPKEDRVYLELKLFYPDLSSRLAGVTAEHLKIAEQSIALRDKVSRIIAGDMVGRNAVVADAMRYIDSLRTHMRWEESDLFRCADSMIAEGHTEIDLSSFVDHQDPIFGAHVEKRFDNLLQRIRSNP